MAVGQSVFGSVPLLLGSVGNFVLLVAAFALLLLGAEIFTNSVEWLGHHLGVSESATGSLLAAVGTALPETMIPVIAILSVIVGTGDQAAADEVGVGAILGAPFMLATIAMFLIGASVWYFREQRESGATFELNVLSTQRDLTIFLIGYSFALAAAFIPYRPVKLAIALGLVILYAWYVRETLTAGQLISSEELEPLHLVNMMTMGSWTFPAIGARFVRRKEPPLSMVFLQTLVAMGIIIGGAHLFVGEVQHFAGVLDVPAAIVALLLAPLATELPEKFNSILWIAEDKDTLAIGNISGAMVFQGTLPATLGILFTSWDLSLSWGTVGFLNAFSALLALIGGGFLLARTLRSDRGRLRPGPFLLGGLLYALFVAVLVYHVVVLDVTASAH